MPTQHTLEPNHETPARLQHFDRALKTVSAHFSRYGKQGKKATVTRALECAFETDTEFSDALAASLMRKADTSPNLKAGLDGWNVFQQEVWLRGARRHEGQTLSEIRLSIETDPQKNVDHA